MGGLLVLLGADAHECREPCEEEARDCGYGREQVLCGEEGDAGYGEDDGDAATACLGEHQPERSVPDEGHHGDGRRCCGEDEVHVLLRSWVVVSVWLRPTLAAAGAGNRAGSGPVAGLGLLGTVGVMSDLVTPRVRTHLEKAWGEAGTAWADRVPDVVKELSYNWGLVAGRPLQSSTSVVLRCTQPGTDSPRVLKLSPVPAQTTPEAGALWSFSALGAAPKPLQSNASHGAVLMELVEDAAPLADELLAASPEELADLVNRLHAAPTPPKPALSQLHEAYLQRLQGALSFLPQVPDAPVTALDLHRSIQLVTQLTMKQARTVVLHGDLSPTTILRSGSGLKVVAPKPSLGDPSFDVAIYALAAASDPSGAPALAEAVSLSAGLEVSRTLSWVRAVASDRALLMAAYGEGTPEERAMLGELSRSR